MKLQFKSAGSPAPTAASAAFTAAAAGGIAVYPAVASMAVPQFGSVGNGDVLTPVHEVTRGKKKVDKPLTKAQQEAVSKYREEMEAMMNTMAKVTLAATHTPATEEHIARAKASLQQQMASERQAATQHRPLERLTITQDTLKQAENAYNACVDQTRKLCTAMRKPVLAEHFVNLYQSVVAGGPAGMVGCVLPDYGKQFKEKTDLINQMLASPNAGHTDNAHHLKVVPIPFSYIHSFGPGQVDVGIAKAGRGFVIDEGRSKVSAYAPAHSVYRLSGLAAATGGKMLDSETIMVPCDFAKMLLFDVIRSPKSDAFATSTDKPEVERSWANSLTHPDLTLSRAVIRHIVPVSDHNPVKSERGFHNRPVKLYVLLSHVIAALSGNNLNAIMTAGNYNQLNHYMELASRLTVFYDHLRSEIHLKELLAAVEVARGSSSAAAPATRAPTAPAPSPTALPPALQHAPAVLPVVAAAVAVPAQPAAVSAAAAMTPVAAAAWAAAAPADDSSPPPLERETRERMEFTRDRPTKRGRGEEWVFINEHDIKGAESSNGDSKDNKHSDTPAAVAAPRAAKIEGRAFAKVTKPFARRAAAPIALAPTTSTAASAPTFDFSVAFAEAIKATKPASA